MASVVIAIDFGTTYSGFAFVHRDEPDEVYLHYNYPQNNGLHYCKTISSILYQESQRQRQSNYSMQSWGWPAQVDYNEHLESRDDAHYSLISKFKLYLAPKSYQQACDRLLESIPSGLTIEQIVSDYLRELGQFALNELTQKFGKHLTMADVQWALTVPAIWDESGKQLMRKCAQNAGLIKSKSLIHKFHSRTDAASSLGSPYPLEIILEPEAAAIYAFHNPTIQCKSKGNFLIVDAGGGTVDLVMQRKILDKGKAKLEQVSKSTGGLCGSAFLDDGFKAMVWKRIGCMEEFCQQYPTVVSRLKRKWDEIKFTFSHESSSTVVDIPAKLTKAWKAHDQRNGIVNEDGYDEIVFSRDDIREIFDSVVDEILDLIQDQLEAASNDCSSIVLVGGFAESPYLQSRIRDTFEPLVPHIVCPPEPGAAICRGAAIQVMQPDVIASRISKKTYGVRACLEFVDELDPIEKLRVSRTTGDRLCRDRFSSFVEIDEIVPVNASITQSYCPIEDDQCTVVFTLHSADSIHPRYTYEEGVQYEGVVEIPLPDTSLGVHRKIDVTLSFGQTMIRVGVKAKNYGEETEVFMEPVRFHSLAEDRESKFMPKVATAFRKLKNIF